MTSLKRFRENTFMKAVVIPLIVTIITVILFFTALPSLIDDAPNAPEYMAQQEQLVTEGGEING